mgnify:CR=1 FL=1
MMSAISSLVRIWKICHSYPGCSFIWNLRVAYFTVKHWCLCNTFLYYCLHRGTTQSHEPFDYSLIVVFLFLYEKHIPPGFLLPNWPLYFSTFNLYLMHPASTVRQATSAVFKYLGKLPVKTTQWSTRGFIKVWGRRAFRFGTRAKFMQSLKNSGCPVPIFSYFLSLFLFSSIFELKPSIFSYF